jgi:hypothetical protein
LYEIYLKVDPIFPDFPQSHTSPLLNQAGAEAMEINGILSYAHAVCHPILPPAAYIPYHAQFPHDAPPLLFYGLFMPRAGPVAAGGGGKHE